MQQSILYFLLLGAAIAFGQAPRTIVFPTTQNGDVAIGGTDSFRFAGTPDDIITVTAKERSSTPANLCIRAIDGTGNVIGPPDCASLSQTIKFRVFRSQFHTIEIYEQGKDRALSYTADFSCSGKCSVSPSSSPYPDPPGGPVKFGDLVRGIVLEGQTHTYSAKVAPNDVLTISLTERAPTTAATACINVSSPSGTSVYTRCSSLSLSGQVRATVDGVYKVDVYDSGRNNPLAYELRVACQGVCQSPVEGGVTEPPSAGLTYGVPKEGIIQANAPGDRFPVDGIGNDVITINLTERAPSTAAAPCARILSPTGAVLVSRCSSLSLSISARLPQSGTHAIEVYEQNNDQSLAYSMTVACTGSCPPPSPTTGSGGSTGGTTTTSMRIVASPNSLTFRAIQGQSSELTAILQLRGEQFSGRYAVRSSASWLTVTPATGTLPVQLDLRVLPAGLPAGESSATLEVTSPDNPNVRVVVPVTLDATDSGPSISPGFVTLRPNASGGDKQYILLKNQSPRSVTFVGRIDSKADSPGVALVPANGSIAPGGERLVELRTIAAAKLDSGRAVFAIDGKELESLFSIQPATATPTDPSVRQIQFDGPTNKQLVPRSLFLLNPAGQSVSVEIESNKQWLFVTPAKFSLEPGGRAEVSLQVNTSGLEAKPTAGLVTVNTANSADIGARQLVVNANVSGDDDAYSKTAISPSGFLVYGYEGEKLNCRALGVDSAECRVEITNFSRGEIPSEVRVEGTVPFESLPQSGKSNVPASQGSASVPRRVTLVPRILPAGTKPGFSTQVITVVAGTRTSLVDVHVLSLGPPPKKEIRAATGCNPRSLRILSASTGPEFVVTGGTSILLDVEVLDDCGEPLRNGTVIASFSSNEPGLGLRPLGNGRWQTAWRPISPDGSRISVELRAWNDGATVSGAARLEALVLGDSSAPNTTSRAVVNAARAGNGGVISPGSLVTVYGSQLSSSTLTARGTPLPQSLGGVSVTVGGQRASLLLVSPTQINLQIPYPLTPNRIVDLIIENQGVYSSPIAISIVPADPEVFAITDLAGAVVDRARPGDTLIAYMTGLGAVSPLVATGTEAPLSPLSRANCTTTVELAGLAPIPAVFAGLSPGFSGLYQVSFQIPPATATSTNPRTMVVRCGEGRSSSVLLRVE